LKSPKLATRAIVERYALAVLYYSTNGKYWESYLPFLTDTSVCTWNTGTGFSKGVTCSDGYVDYVSMNFVNLTGTFPWEISLLQGLITFDLLQNNVSGPLPSQLSTLTKLEHFNMLGNKLSGRLPRTLSSTLKSHTLSYNLFTGNIPVSLPTSIRSVQYVDIENNKFTGGVPAAFGQLANLDVFEFGWNDLIGSVDAFLCNDILRRWDTLEADCEQVKCSCCTSCCKDGGPLYCNPM